ncbi:hypothetical protein PG984_000307 [Apiospora sp. TS-2023a]
MKLFLGVLAFAARVSMGSAHDASPDKTGSPAATQTAAAPAIHTISVGAAGFSFRPDSVTANVGDIVRFNFYPTNHSVARAEFRYPCIPYETVEIGRRGFYSDLMPVQAILNDPPHFDVKINDTEPIFFYCTLPGSCLDESMIGVINPNATFTLDIQKQYVANSTFEFAPGQPFPMEMPRPDPKVPGGYMAPTVANTTGARVGDNNKHNDSMSGAVVAGIVVGGAALLGVIAGLLFLCYRKRRHGSHKGRHHRGHMALRSTPSPIPMRLAAAVTPARPPRSPRRASSGLIFACKGEREPSSRSGTPRGGAKLPQSAGGARRMSPTVQEQDEAAAYSSPEAPYYGMISPMTKPDHSPRQQQHQQSPSYDDTSAYPMSNNQYHPRAPIMLPSRPQTPQPVELPVSADHPGNAAELPPRYYNNWSRPFSWRRGVDYNYRPDNKVVGANNMI